MGKRPFFYLRNLVSTEKKWFARTLRRNATQAERVLWQHIRRKNLGPRFRRQAILRGWIADFYCPAAGLVVEVDGSSHCGREVEDARRDATLTALGFRVLRLQNAEVLNDPESAVGRIRSLLQCAGGR